MEKDDHFIKLENMMHSAPFVKLTGAKVFVEKGTAEITLPVRKDFHHAAFFAANSLVKDVFVLTTSFTTYLTRPVSEGVVTAYGKVVNHGRSQLIGESVLYNEKGKEIARASGIFVRSKIPLSENIGYK